MSTTLPPPPGPLTRGRVDVKFGFGRSPHLGFKLHETDALAARKVVDAELCATARFLERSDVNKSVSWVGQDINGLDHHQKYRRSNEVECQPCSLFPTKRLKRQERGNWAENEVLGDEVAST